MSVPERSPGHSPESFAVLKVVDGYEPSTTRDRAAKYLISTIIAEDPESVRRSDGYSHVTASSLIVNSQLDRILLHRHKKLGKWLPFGGHHEPQDNSPADTARREAGEETGILGLRVIHSEAGAPLLLDLDVHVIPVSPKNPAHLHLDFRYLFVADDLSVSPADDESSELSWLSENSAMDLAADENVLSCIRKVFELTRRTPDVFKMD